MCTCSCVFVLAICCFRFYRRLEGRTREDVENFLSDLSDCFCEGKDDLFSEESDAAFIFSSKKSKAHTNINFSGRRTFPLHYERLPQSCHLSSGAITIVKSITFQGLSSFVIGACTLEEEEYNRRGEIIFYTPDDLTCKTLDGHYTNTGPSTSPLRQTVSDVQYSPNSGVFFSCGYDHMIRLWNASLLVQAQTRTSSATLSGPTSYMDFSIHMDSLSPPESLRPVATWKGHRGRINAMARHTSDLLLASSSQDGSVLMWPYQLERTLACRPTVLFKKQVKEKEISNSIDSVVFCDCRYPDWLCAATSYDCIARKGTVDIWDGVAMRKIGVIGDDKGGVSCIAIDPSGTLLAIGGGTCMMRDDLFGDGILRVYDLRLVAPSSRMSSYGSNNYSTLSLDFIGMKSGHRDTDTVFYSPDGLLIASCQGTQSLSEIVLFDRRFPTRPLHILQHQATTRSASEGESSLSSSMVASCWMNGRSSMLVTGGIDGRIKIWDVRTGKDATLDFFVDDHECVSVDRPVNSVAISSCDDLIVAGTESGAVHTWSLSRSLLFRQAKV